MKRFLIALILLLVGAARAEADDIAVIVNARFPSDSISVEDVREIYRSKIQFISGARIKPVDQRETQEIRSAFLSDIMRWTKTDYTKYWMHLVFLEGTVPPVIRDSSQAVIQTVQESEGSIGYVWAHEAAGAKGVKTVTVLRRPAGK
jgi:ABC-type phosphate transport system substrate-binding protein